MDTKVYDEDSFEKEDTPEAVEATEDEIDDFKNQVSEWLKLDEQISKLLIATRERRKQRSAIEALIKDFMKKHKYDNLNTQQGLIKRTVKERPLPVKITEIKQHLFDPENELLAVKDLLPKIFGTEERPKVVKESLRRVVNKVSSTMDI